MVKLSDSENLIFTLISDFKGPFDDLLPNLCDGDRFYIDIAVLLGFFLVPVLLSDNVFLLDVA
jgi:hypothetical protein